MNTDQEVAVLLRNLRVSTLVGSEAARSPAVQPPSPAVAAAAAQGSTTSLPPFLAIDPEMAGAVYDLRVTDKHKGPNDGDDFYDKDENIFPDRAVPARTGLEYRILIRIDPTRVAEGTDIELSSWTIINGSWVRSGEYGHFSVDSSFRGNKGYRIDDPSKAINHYYVRAKVAGRTAMVDDYYIIPGGS